MAALYRTTVLSQQVPPELLRLGFFFKGLTCTEQRPGQESDAFEPRRESEAAALDNTKGSQARGKVGRRHQHRRAANARVGGRGCKQRPLTVWEQEHDPGA